jgi:transcriptional regulator EpsA
MAITAVTESTGELASAGIAAPIGATHGAALAAAAPTVIVSAHCDEGSSQADFLQIESIVLNLDASLRVHARAHFFSWTQGLLQSLIRHELLICTMCHGKPPTFRADGFSMASPDPAAVSDLFLRDTSVAPALLKAWEERRFQPVTTDLGADPAALGGGQFSRELARLGSTQLLSHGVHDADGRALSLFTFVCRPGSLGARQSYLAQLLAPAMHSAWVRTQVTRAPGAADKSHNASILTVRELDILKWIYLGKSNFEIGAILKISPLTVKNHVQKILRKLNVVNRTQAIGKSLELRIFNP